MKRCTLHRASTFLALFSVLLVANIGWSADKEKSDKDKSDIEKRIDNSAKVIDEIMATPDKGIPDKIMSDAKCIAGR